MLGKNNDKRHFSTGREQWENMGDNQKTLLNSRRRYAQKSEVLYKKSLMSNDLKNDGIYQYDSRLNQNLKTPIKGASRVNSLLIKNANVYQKFLHHKQHISIKVQERQSRGTASKQNISMDARYTNAYAEDSYDYPIEDSIYQNSTLEDNESSLSSLTIDQNSKIEAQITKLSGRHDDRYRHMSKIDCTQMLRNTDKELKGIKYKLSTVISSGEYHNSIDPRYDNKQIEIIKETPIYCKIPCKNEYAPGKITIWYDSDFKNDMLIYTSLSNPMPSGKS